MHLGTLWRIAAFITLLLYAAMAAIIVKTIFNNFGLSVAIALTVVLLLYALWLLFSGSEYRAMKGWFLLGFGLLAAAIDLVVIFKNLTSIWLIALFVISVAVYVTLVRILREKYWQEKRKSALAAHETASFKRPYLIINPISGNGRAIKAHIDEIAKKRGITVLFTKKNEGVEVVARRAADEGADVLGISGGDGSIGAVAKVAIERHIPVVVLPGGTKCHFARDLGLDPKRIVDALAGFQGVERLVDVADINGRIFLNNASFGLYADIVDNVDYREHKVRVSHNVLRDIVEGVKDLYDLQFRHGKLQFHKAAEVLVGVNPYETLHVFELGHRERLDGGQLQITAITQLNDGIVGDLLKLISIDKLRRRQSSPGLYQWADKTFKITASSKTIVAGVDGEREEYVTPITVRIRPQALHIFEPAEGIRNRPKNPFSKFVIRHLWNAADL